MERNTVIDLRGYRVSRDIAAIAARLDALEDRLPAIRERIERLHRLVEARMTGRER